ncbi:MAG: hypothetical protein M1833_003832 [Piccolia ochrophora]|nr:MAG: hypothetical protein M1833_003832 [Piccolia ochrophora]
MAPIRRYLRISKYSVLECRIYLDNPALANAWLLNPRDPILPRVIECVRPLVLPKLREENDRSRGKGKKAQRGVKDVIAQDGFEVSVFLTDVLTRHALLTKQKTFGERATKISSNSVKMMQGSNARPIELDESTEAPVAIREESVESDENLNFDDIPVAIHSSGVEVDLMGNHLVEESLEPDVAHAEPQDDDDKKKLGFNTSYDGFNIYGKILCLIVRRTQRAGDQRGNGTGQAMMEDWIASTQVGIPVHDAG